MEYTIKKLATMSGISTRTLRHYDEIGLLKPGRINSSGYRIYGSFEVDRLQHILFYRELGFSLQDIKSFLDDKDFDHMDALSEHREALVLKKEQLETLIRTVDLTIASKKGDRKMQDKDKFEGFKKKMIDDNEAKYGEEIREKYGKEVVEASNNKFANLTEAEFNEMERLGEKVLELLKQAMKTGDVTSEIAQELAQTHRDWLSFTWPKYTGDAHLGLAQMYVADERFTAFYDDKAGAGAAQFLCDAIEVYVRNQ